jgi:hypothetical protein
MIFLGLADSIAPRRICHLGGSALSRAGPFAAAVPRGLIFDLRVPLAAHTREQLL